MFSRINDKLLHFLACLVITLTVVNSVPLRQV